MKFGIQVFWVLLTSSDSAADFSAFSADCSTDISMESQFDNVISKLRRKFHKGRACNTKDALR
jgi:hypothetical protein